MSNELRDQIYEYEQLGEPFVVVTLVNTKGSAPQEVGAKIIVGTEGYLAGTIGGGKVEQRVIEHAKTMLLENKKFDFTEWNLQTDIKMTCGGVVSFFFERIQKKPKWTIAIFGAGHVSQELVRVLLRLDCSLICIDPRAEWLERLPTHHNLKKVHAEEMKEVIETLAPETFIVSMTMGHAFDFPILLEALKKNHFPYLGAIGSSSKAAVLRADLLKNGIDHSFIQKLHCPIGEEFGNNTPAEIALSVAAQLIKKRDEL